MDDIRSETPTPGLEAYINEFLTDRISELKELNIHLENSEFEAIRAVAHKWKGFCAPYGFNHLETLGIALEKKATELSLTDVSDLLLQIRDYLALKEEIIKGE